MPELKNTIKKINSSLRKWLFSFALNPALASIASSTNRPPATIRKGTEVQAAIENVAGFMFNIFTALAVIFVIFAAFLYLTASGNTSQLDRAKNVLIYAIVAIVLALVAGGIVTLIKSIIGVSGVPQ
jgi:hypothetical protein